MDIAWEIMEIAASPDPLARRREELGQRLLRTFGAASFISYRSDPSGPYADPVAINLGDDRLRAYDTHYRHIDTLTPRLQRRGRASAVTLNPIAHDEFAHDFLFRAGMHHGMNYFAPNAAVGSVDLRVWRPRAAGGFSAEDVRMLQAIGDLVHRLWDTEPSAAVLSPREQDVARLVAEGLSDRGICETLGISHPTLRTHLAHAFAKTGARNRAALATYTVTHRQK
ncbi:response regulator transcription factor [Microbacterium sp. 179-I 3D3 NHS]|uniref:helix-turn-helix transcriptional regulator n=1 Tax=unclassified Microbacterium TaxID=2609290 RepID=UPI0039A30D64